MQYHRSSASALQRGNMWGMQHQEIPGLGHEMADDTIGRTKDISDTSSWYVLMRITRTIPTAGILSLLVVVLVIGASASAGESWFLGDTITLSGYSPESSTVYLFLTGPNLPSSGVALDDISSRADQGGLTRVRVDDQDRWVYRWDTHSLGGRLDPGTYTVWVTSEPVDRARLGNANYRTIPITLARPGIVIKAPDQPGALLLRSTPNGTSVVLDGEYRGASPLILEGLKPGTYNVTFSRFGYTQQTLPVTVEAGMRAEIDVTLIPATGSLRIATSPGGGRLMLDGADAGISPVTLTKIPAGNHTITAAKEGYAPAAQTVRVIAGQTVTADLVLEPAVPAHATQRAGGLIPSIIPAVFVFLLFLIICCPRSLR